MLKELLWLIPVGLGFFSLGFSIANIIWMNWNKGKNTKIKCKSTETPNREGRRRNYEKSEAQKA